MKQVKPGKVIIGFVVIVIMGGAYWNWKQATIIKEQQTRIRELSPKTDSSAKSFELQRECAKQAEAFIDYWEKDPQSKLNDEFSNHYNVKLNKCFVLITQYPKHPGGSVDNIFEKYLFDAIEKKLYGQYGWAPQEGKKYWEVPPLVCTMLDQTCQSEAEFEAFVNRYMGAN